jgi:hypothetical protein
MNPPIFEICNSNAAVRSLLRSGNITRLYKFGMAPENVTKPYAVWQTISGAPENFINQLPDMDRYSIQVDVYAVDSQSSESVAEALRNAIEPNAHIVRWGGTSKDPETNLYRYSFDIDWFVPR